MKRFAGIAFGIAMALTPVAIVNTPTTAVADHTQQDGYNDGYREGYRRGYRDGAEGHRYHYHPPDGYDPYTEGQHQGRHEGYHDGYRDGRNGVTPQY